MKLNSYASLIALASCLIATASCRHSFEEVRLAQAAPKLSTQSIVYVAIPPDARYKKDLVYNSGQAAAEVVRNAFDQHVRRAYIGRQPESLDEAVAVAQQSRCHYIVYPSLLRWEDHSTEFSGIRDKIEVKIEVYDAATRQLLHAAVLKGASRWLTDGGDTPKDLLRDPVEKFVASLFQPRYTPSALQ